MSGEIPVSEGQKPCANSYFVSALDKPVLLVCGMHVPTIDVFRREALPIPWRGNQSPYKRLAQAGHVFSTSGNRRQCRMRRVRLLQ
jgi:hypothetical protein